jgi:predicted RNA-binding Zn-ribbon protein involved in translation (DUF1610 family)
MEVTTWCPNCGVEIIYESYTLANLRHCPDCDTTFTIISKPETTKSRQEAADRLKQLNKVK